MTPRDTQRSSVYAAEEFVRTLFDRAAEHGNPVVDFFGTQLTLPPEGRFASVSTVQRYVDEVLAHPVVRVRWPDVGPLSVRARRGSTAAHYLRTGDAATIAVPERHTTWALRELVVFFGHFTAVYSTIPAENPVGGGLMTAGISLPQHRARITAAGARKPHGAGSMPPRWR